MSYTKTTWVTGDIVTAPKLNNLENGVYNNDQKISELETSESTLQGNMAAPYDATATYAVGDYCTYEGQLQRCIVPIETPEAWTAARWTAVSVGDEIGNIKSALETKAEIDGYYEEMTVGDAEQLIATTYVEDEEPYIFRATGGSADVGNREYLDKIVGASVAWNQNIKGGDFSALTSDIYIVPGCNGTVANNVLTVTVNEDISQSFVSQLYYSYAIATHKVLIAVKVKSSKARRFVTTNLFTGAVINLSANTWTNYATVGICSATAASFGVRLYSQDGFTSGDIMEVKDFVGYDLTQMLGTTIADYVYSLETATAGAGVAWLRQYIDIDSYHPYSAPTMKHVEGLTSHDTVGFNQWDEEYEVGGYSISNGEKVTGTSRIRSKNKIRIIPNTAYYFASVGAYSAWVNICFYDADENYISNITPNVNKGFTTPSGAAYMTFNTSDAYGTTYKNDICINLSWSGYRNGEYEPYIKHSYPLDSSVVLRGIPTLVDGKMVYDGDEYAYDGTVKGIFDIVDLGSLNWTKQAGTGGQLDRYSTTGIASIVATEPVSNGCMLQLVCPMFVSNSDPEYGRTKDKTMCVLASNGTLYITASGYESASDFKTAMNGVLLVYRRAAPNISSAEPYQQIQICDDFGTEEFVGAEIPVGTETRYPANLRDKLQHLPSPASADGTYLISQTDKQMTLIPYQAPTGLPTAPTTDGNYNLKATVTDGAVTYSWEAQA